MAIGGEISQICDIVTAGRKAICSGSDIHYTDDVISTEFQHRPKRFSKKTHISSSVDDWFKKCLRSGLIDMQLLMPISVSDFNLLGYANTSRACILCFWKNRSLTCFAPHWSFDEDNGGWRVTYREYYWKKALKMPVYADRSKELSEILLSMESFAGELEEAYYAEVFRKARELLENQDADDDEDSYVGQTLLNLPDQYRNLYRAIRRAHVFGAMMSWNDSPAYYAVEKGLGERYDLLSGRLLEEIHLNLLYVINESWKDVDEN